MINAVFLTVLPFLLGAAAAVGRSRSYTDAAKELAINGFDRSGEAGPVSYVWSCTERLLDSVKQHFSRVLDGVKWAWNAWAVVTGSSSRSARDRLLDAATEEVTAAAGPGQVSLRAIARRAGLSHNAAEYHFQDRSGLLTALAVKGFHRLEADLRQALDAATQTGADPLAALGGAYLDFGLTDPNTLELMFRADLVRPQDPDLEQAQQRAFGVLEKVATKATGHVPAGHEGDLPTIAWAFVHGLVSLARYGALRPTAAPPDPRQTEQMARNLMATFTSLLRAQRTKSTAPPVPDSRR